jgi:hypothetical protein
MFKKRLFNLLIAIALAIVIALTVREAAATAELTAETESAKGTKASECASLPSQYSIRTEYVQEADMWIVRTENGPSGVDGGLIDLLSSYRPCAR